MRKIDQGHENSLLSILLVSYLFLAVLGPSQFTLANMPFGLQDVLLILSAYYVLFLAAKRGSFEVPKMLVAFYLLLLALSVSLFYGALMNWSENLPGFYHELMRIVKYVLVVCVFYYAGKTQKSGRRLIGVFFTVSVAAVIIAIAQAFNILGINGFIMKYYKPGSIQSGLVDISYRKAGGLRAYSTFYNPNIFGLFCILPFIYSCAIVLAKKSVRTAIPLAGFFFVGILLSQSRTALLCSFLAVAITAILNAKRSAKSQLRLSKRLVLVFFAIVIAAVLIFSVIGLKRITDISSSDGSVAVRLRIVGATVDQVLDQSPFLGLSVANRNQQILDNEFLYFFYWGGLVGLLLYVTFIGILYKSIPKTPDPLQISVCAIIIVFLFANLTSGTFLSEKIYVVFIALYGLAIAKPKADQSNLDLNMALSQTSI